MNIAKAAVGSNGKERVKDADGNRGQAGRSSRDKVHTQ